MDSYEFLDPGDRLSPEHDERGVQFSSASLLLVRGHINCGDKNCVSCSPQRRNTEWDLVTDRRYANSDTAPVFPIVHGNSETR